MFADDSSRRSAALVAVVVVHLLIGWMVISGLAVRFARAADQAIETFSLPADTEDSLSEEPELEGASAEADLLAEPPPVLVTAPEIELELPPAPAVEAPEPAEGEDNDAGRTDVEGDGSAGGGDGDGLGYGGAGLGLGGGFPVTRPQHLSGNILSYDAIPVSLRGTPLPTSTTFRFIVLPNGRITNCNPITSTGNPALDEWTCEALEDRLRFEPARDARGAPVASEFGWRQDWRLER